VISEVESPGVKISVLCSRDVTREGFCESCQRIYFISRCFFRYKVVVVNHVVGILKNRHLIFRHKKHGKLK
jgi:hypothetical protein